MKLILQHFIIVKPVSIARPLSVTELNEGYSRLGIPGVVQDGNTPYVVQLMMMAIIDRL